MVRQNDRNVYYFVNIHFTSICQLTYMQLALCCNVVFEPAFELPARVSLNSKELDGNAAEVDLVLIQPFQLSGVNRVVLSLTSIFQAQFS